MALTTTSRGISAPRGGPPTGDRVWVVGRDAELTVLADAVTAAAGNRSGAAFLIAGEPGAGVSTVLRAAAEQATTANCSVLVSAGTHTEAGLPFAVLHRLLQPILRQAEQLPAVQREALHTAFALQAGPAPDPFLVALGTLSLLTSSAADRPVVAVVDNFQWLDKASAEILTFVARRVSDVPIMLLSGLRQGHSAAAHDMSFRQLTVGRLDRGSARLLLNRIDADLTVEQQNWILAQSVGNPLALLQLATTPPSAHDLQNSIPPTPWISPLLEQALLGQLGDLPDITRDALLIAAIGDTDELSEILTAATIFSGQTATAAVLDPAEQINLLRFDEVHVHFRHPLVRPAITQRETVVRRQTAHRAWGIALSEPSARRAWHRSLAATGPDEAIADELEAIAQRIAPLGQLPEAIAALERSAALTSRPSAGTRRLLIAAEHARTIGRPEHAAALLTAAQRNGIDGMNIVRAELFHVTPMAGIPDDSAGVARLADMYEQAIAAGERDLAFKALTAAAQRCWWSAAPAADRARVADLAQQAYQARPDGRCILAMAMAEPVRRGTQVMRMLDGMNLPAVTDAAGLAVLGLAAHAVGDEVRAAELSNRAIPELRRQGRIGALAHALGVGSTAQLDLGDWAGAAASSAEGSTLARAAGQLIGSAGAAVNQARYLALQGDYPAALQQVAQVEYDPLLRTLNNFLCRAQIVRGISWISAGRHADAFHALQRVFDPQDPSHHEREQLGGIMYLAEAAVRCGQRDDARKTLSGMETLATITGAPVLNAHLLYARAVLSDDQHAEQLYIAALNHDLSRWTWITARIQLAFGSWLRRQQRKTDARQLLRPALQTFTELGAAAWAAQALGELNATGGHRERQDEHIMATLSAQEILITHLAAKGLSNSEIGQQLGLSPRTVASHLYRIFPKLDITSRTQLAGMLDR